MDTIIQNVATLAVERCLLHGLANIVSSSTMNGLDVDTVSLIADEHPHARNQRTRNARQQEILSEVLESCHTHTGRQTYCAYNILDLCFGENIC